MRQDDARRRRRDRRARRRRPPHAAGRLRRRLRRQPLDDAGAGRHHPDPVRPRPADGAAGVPLARAAPAAGALSRQVVLQRPAPGAGGLLEVLRPGGPRQHVVLPRARAAGHHAGQLRLPPACSMRRPARSSTSSSSTSASGSCASPSPTPIARGASSSPAMPPTAIRPTAATASTPASRMRATSAGSSPPRCRAGRAQACSTPTTRSGGRCSSRRRATSSRRPSRPTARSWQRSIPQRDKEAFEREWGARKSGARSEVNAFEPNYEGSPIVCGPPGGRCSARRLARLRGARRPPSGAPAALLGAQRVRGAGRRLHAPRSRRR